jgi:N-acyl-D-amino-acid deacylase
MWEQYRLNGFRRPENRRFEFQPIDKIAQELGTDVYKTICALMKAEDGRLFFTGTGIDDDELEVTAQALYQVPGYSFMTDTIGIGKNSRATTRYSTFPRLLGRHVNQLKTFSLEEAVSRCTSLAAEQMGLTDRGLIKKGYVADITIFDSEQLLDKATFAEPFQFAEGISTVIINGKPVWHDNVFLPSGPAGEVIKRQSR